MKCIRRLVMAAVFLLAALPLHAQESRPLTVFAAASLTDAFEAIAVEFEAANPGVEVLFNFAGSSDLAAQLAQGAPADVFASANARQMQAAIDAARIAGEPLTFARNRLVLITPTDNPAAIVSLADLANDGVQIVIAAEGVPVRDYTETMLEGLTADPAYGDDYAAAFRANIVSEEPNVRQVAAKIALGEADAGIVYVSDVTPDLQEEVIAFPIADEFNTIATYPIAVTDDAAETELAQAFVDYVVSNGGQRILSEWNFVTVCQLIEMDIAADATAEAIATPELNATVESTPEAAAELPACA